MDAAFRNLKLFWTKNVRREGKLISCKINVNFVKFTSYFAKTSFFAKFKKRKFVRLYRHPPTTPSSQVDKSRMEAAELANSPPPCGKNKLPTSTQKGF
jgi:hypothetical protein